MLIALATGQLGYAANNWLASSKVAVLAAANFDPQQTLSDSTCIAGVGSLKSSVRLDGKVRIFGPFTH